MTRSVTFNGLAAVFLIGVGALIFLPRSSQAAGDIIDAKTQAVVSAANTLLGAFPGENATAIQFPFPGNATPDEATFARLMPAGGAGWTAGCAPRRCPSARCPSGHAPEG